MGDVLEFTKEALWLVLLLSGPPVAAAALVGLVVAFLICAECAGASEVEGPVMADALSMLARSLGFTTRAHVIELLGTCRRCRKDAR